MSFKVLSNKLRKSITITINDRISFLCSEGKAITNCEVIVKYIPVKKVIELISFRKYLVELGRSYEGIIEEVAERIYNDVYELVKPKALIVTLKCESQLHGDVEVKI